MKEENMEPIHTDSYRGWEIKVFPREDGTFTAIYGNEYGYCKMPEEAPPADVDTCVRRACRHIDMCDSFDPHLRSAAYKDIEPRPYEAWLVGDEPD